MEGRQVAARVRLRDLKEGTYVRVEGEWKPNFIQTPDGRKFSRINVVGVVATEPMPEMNYSSFVVEDGTSRVPVRIFGDLKMNAGLGDVVTIIGRPREYSQQVYIVPEIVKKIEDRKWVEYRRLELAGLPEKVPEVVREEPKENSVDAVIKAVQELDSGNGADALEVAEKTGIAECDKIIDSLLKEGEIFEISSGRLKVLE